MCAGNLLQPININTCNQALMSSYIPRVKVSPLPPHYSSAPAQQCTAAVSNAESITTAGVNLKMGQDVCVCVFEFLRGLGFGSLSVDFRSRISVKCAANKR